jgi:hypothetical protein
VSTTLAAGSWSQDAVSKQRVTANRNDCWRAERRSTREQWPAEERQGRIRELESFATRVVRVVGRGGDFSAAFRMQTLEVQRLNAQSDASAEPGSDGHRHFPYARRLRTEWSRGPDGGWVAAAEDARLWEVFCAECGDTDGPANEQSDAVQQLRGPYKSQRHARHVATKHYEEN